MRKPSYNELTGFEPSPPPFSFQDVTSRVFPLRASARRLQTFCDRYLNLAPDISYCRPLMPQVLLCILDYGRMDSDSSGWISQNEVLFTLILEWWHREPDGREVTEIASVTPFIFVDDPLSQTTGREVYGWPKIKAWYEPDIATWGQDVVTRPRTIRMSTLVFPRAYEGQRPQRRTLLEIDVEPQRGLTDWPPDLRFMADTVQGWQRGLEGAFKSARDWIELLAMRGPAGNLSLLSRIPTPGIVTSAFGLAAPGGEDEPADPEAEIPALPDLAFSTLTLKQFPDPSSHRSACYQALVASDMAIRRYKRWGLLGEAMLARGDTTGGFVVRLHDYPEFPIVDALGLDVESWQESPDPLEGVVRGVTRDTSHLLAPFPPSEDEGPGRTDAVATLRPVFPYWLDADLVYGTGRTVCARTPGRDWCPGEHLGQRTHKPLLYNTSAGEIVVPLQGPFRFRNVTVRAMALRADLDRLQSLIDDYLNNAQDLRRFEVALDLAFLYALNYENTESESNDVGWWADREVGFSLLLKEEGDEVDAPEYRYFLTVPFLFGNSQFAALTLRETYGLPILRAEIESPPDAWMSHRGPETDRSLLRLSTAIFPSTTADLRARWRTLVEVHALADSGETPGPQPEERRPEAIEQAIRSFEQGGEAPEWWARSVFLRRFRDATEPDRACFQALLEGSIGVTRIHAHALDPATLEVRIHHHPSHPLVEKLGLEVARREHRPSDRPGRAWEGRPVDVLRPIHALWATADLESGYRDHELHIFPPPVTEHDAADLREPE